MKIIIALLAVFFLFLQDELWFAPGGVVTVWRMQHKISLQQQANQKLAHQNQALDADIKDLKSGNEAIEERARHDLGMIKKNETFYRVVKQ